MSRPIHGRLNTDTANARVGSPGADEVVRDWLRLLPRVPYRPGRTARPPAGFLDVVVDAAPAITTASGWRDNRTYLFGYACSARGAFWEAHEVWEPVWMRALPNSRERFLLRALIHIANAALKNALDRPDAAARLCTAARAELAEIAKPAEAELMGTHPAKLEERLVGGSASASDHAKLFADMPIMQYIA